MSMDDNTWNEWGVRECKEANLNIIFFSFFIYKYLIKKEYSVDEAWNERRKKRRGKSIVIRWQRHLYNIKIRIMMTSLCGR